MALKKKNEFIKKQGEKARADRDSIIRKELADFKELQELAQKRDKLVKKLETLAD